jgi:hypothetical protein
MASVTVNDEDGVVSLTTMMVVATNAKHSP